MKYSALIIIIASVSSFILSSCLAKNPYPTSEALLEQSSAETRKEIERLVGEMLNSRPIKLADTVFSKKSNLIVERHQPNPESNNIINGREISNTETFTLLLQKDQCLLRHNQSNQTRLLKDVKCISN